MEINKVNIRKRKQVIFALRSNCVSKSPRVLGMYGYDTWDYLHSLIWIRAGEINLLEYALETD